ncbi:Ig-like domain-containing protein, partial [Staphylococcus xylosus]
APEAPVIGDTTNNSNQVTGTAEANSTVKVTFPSGAVVETTADENGRFTANIPEDEALQGGETIQATSIDAAGNVSQPGSAIVIDTTAPDAPKISHVTSVSTEVTGTAEANSTVKVTFPSGAVVETTADAQGNFTVAIPEDEALQGGETIQAISTDDAGNVSHPGSTTVTDETAPEPPTVNGVTSEDTQVTGTAEANSTVTVKFPNGVTVKGESDANGNYTIAIPDEVDLVGGEEIQVISTDDAGNETAPVATTVTDVTAPEAPTVNEVTSEATSVSGTAEPGSTVTVTFPDGTTATGTADDQGNYTVDIPTTVNLDGGEAIRVVSEDKDGNVSSETTTTVVDTTAPEAPTVNEVTSEATSVSGTAEPGSTVTVTFPDGTTATGTADDQGNYTIEIPSSVKLDGGELIRVVSEDKDGNVSSETTTTVVDTTAPEAPTVNEVTSEDTTVSGTAEPGSTVTVTFPDGTTATATTDDQGNYTVDIPTTVNLDGGEAIRVVAEDKDGNVSSETT